MIGRSGDWFDLEMWRIFAIFAENLENYGGIEVSCRNADLLENN